MKSGPSVVRRDAVKSVPVADRGNAAKSGPAVVSTAALLALLGLGFAACRSAPPSIPGAPAAPAASTALAEQAQNLLEAARLRAASVSGLRARLRAVGPGSPLARFSSQVLLAERPGRLRVEVLGPFGRRLQVLATGGAAWEYYQAGAGDIVRVPVSDINSLPVAWLGPLAGEVTPDLSVALLLAAPPVPNAAPRRSEQTPEGLRIDFAGRSFLFGAGGELAEVRLQGADGAEALSVRYRDWRELPGGRFPFRVELYAAASGARLTLEFLDAELNPDLAGNWFRLSSAQHRPTAPGEGAE